MTETTPFFQVGKFPTAGQSLFCAAILTLVLWGSFASAEVITIQTVAGTGDEKLNDMSGKATEVNIGQPFGVEIGKDKALYITEVSNHRVLRVDLKSGDLTTVAGTGEKGLTGDGGLATEAKLNEPYEVRFDDAGNMYFVEMMNHVVRRVDAKTKQITTVAGTGEAGHNFDAGDATKIKLNRPHSIAVNPEGTTLYIADIGNHRIRRVDLKSGQLDTIAGNGKRDLPEDGQVALGNAMAGPRALYLKDNVLWIALREGHSVWKLDLATGKLAHIAGTGKQGFSGDLGPAKEATFNGPKGIAVDAIGNIYVVDTENQVIRKINPELTVTTVAGRGPKFRGGKGDGDRATLAEMDRPHGVCVDAKGNIFIGDTNNHRVRMVDAPTE